MTLIPWKNKQKEEQTREMSPMASLRADMDRLFDTFIREPFGTIDWSFGGAQQWTPAVDLAETEQEVTIRAEVPGINPDDLEVTVSGQQLVLSGEKREATEKKGEDFYHTESRYGSFRRSIPLPDRVDPQKVQAEYANGVLTIHLEKTPATAPKRIHVKVNE
jgi:HSP20 family protein